MAKYIPGALNHVCPQCNAKVLAECTGPFLRAKGALRFHPQRRALARKKPGQPHEEVTQ